jgi:hypothetical protein
MDTHVAYDVVDGVTVSTIFLGINTSFIGPPRLFETMVFGGEYDMEQERYSTWDEAEAGHTRWLAKALLTPCLPPEEKT